MRKTLLTIILVSFATLSFSQQVSRYVVASGGNYSTASGISVSSTIGEPMVNTLTATGFILTQGFQQASITYYGCTDSNACNYDSTATVDDGSCLTVYGCMDVTACNYDSTAVCDDGSCLIVYGCTDSTALNYNISATCDDGSCIALVNGCMDTTALNFNPLANTNDTCYYCDLSNNISSNNPTSFTACDAWMLTTSTSSYSIVSYNWSNSLGQNIGVGQYVTNLCNGVYTLLVIDAAGCQAIDTITFSTAPVLGCTDPNAFNYNPSATSDDGSCIACVFGCVDSLACNYDSLATCNDGTCLTVFGCTDSTACNYNITATCDDGSCWFGVYGCTDSLACNYNSLATCDDGSCTFPFPGYDCNGNCLAANACLCASSCNSAFTNVNDEHITNVTFAGINNTSAGIAGGPVDYTITTTGATVSQGSTHNIYVTLFNPSAYAEYIRVWFDWNQNGSFADAGEYYLVAGPVNTIGPHTASILVPTTATLGTTRMRVMCIYNDPVPDPCISATYGEAEDYCVTVGGVPGCTDPLACNYDSTATVDDGSCLTIYGCTNPTALNYDPNACVDDGSCTSPAVCGAITGVHLTDIIHDRSTFNWDDMNSATCDVDQIRIRYSDDNGATYSTKTMGAPVGNNAPALNTSKRVLNLSASTTYVYDFKIWYQDGTVVSWHAGGTFTTVAICENVTNVTVTPLNNVLKADFCWTAPSTPYSFVRLKYREDVAGSSFSNIGGMGVMSPTLCKEKGGLTPGTNYRVMWRTWCNPSGGPYRSPQWDGPVIWTQPNSIRVDELSSINSLEVYPNPSRDVFNVEFTSETKQSIEVRLVNLVGEIIFTENLVDFEGEYTHSFNLEQYSKGIYLLELDTDNGIINKKLILQ